MSLIVYGPQGTGKTRLAPKILAHFKLQRVVEDDSLACPRNLYAFAASAPRGRNGFDIGKTLFITNESPPPHLAGDPRIISIGDVKSAIDNRGGN